MLKGLDSHIEEQLRRAEEAESEVNRLGSLAAEAPRLRVELARSQRRQERNGNSQTALEQVRREMAAAKERQAEVPLTLETVSKLVYSLYSLLKDVDAHRREALRLMGIVDFSFLRNCDLDEPLRRDVANFIMAHVVSPERGNQDRAAASAAVSQDRNIPAPEMAPAASPNGSPE